jgi:PleD family two-component response regulator
LETLNTVDALTGAYNRRAMSADEALYLAKSQGRDRAVFSDKMVK